MRRALTILIAICSGKLRSYGVSRGGFKDGDRVARGKEDGEFESRPLNTDIGIVERMENLKMMMFQKEGIKKTENELISKFSKTFFKVLKNVSDSFD